MTLRRCTIICILVRLFLPWGLSQALTSKGKDSARDTSQTCIFISDTQEPMWFEEFFVRTHRNEEATKILFRTISADSSVNALFFLGDVVAMSSIDRYWAVVDTFLADLNVRHIPAYAAAGNHDYLLFSRDGAANLKKRFPRFCRTGYTVRHGGMAVVLLNSNIGELTDTEKVQQMDWYRSELRTLEQDSAVRFVVVGCHHPPFSNSRIVGHSQYVRDKFVPPFNASSKCRLFLSGHAHTFQHFNDTVAGKHFLVIGGGGGLLHTLTKEKQGEMQDQVPWNEEYRMFHFIRETMERDTVKFTVMMLKKDLSGPDRVYEVQIPLQK